MGKKHTDDFSRKIRAGMQLNREHRNYLMLGCPIPPPSPLRNEIDQLKRSIDKDEIEIHFLQEKVK